MDENEKRTDGAPIIAAKDAAQTATAVGGAAGAALLLHPTTPAGFALAAALLALFPPVVAMMTEATARRMRTRADRFLQTIIDEWARDEDKTQEEVAGLLEARRNDPDVSDAIWRAVRALMEAPNDAAAVPLGVLAAEYGRTRRSPDTFFRGTVHLLSELSQNEVAELQGVLTWVLTSTRRSHVTVLASDMKEEPRGDCVRVPWFARLRRDDPDSPGKADSGNDAWLVCSAPPENAGRLFALLKAHGLGNEPSLGVIGPAVLVELERVATERLLRVLRTSG